MFLGILLLISSITFVLRAQPFLSRFWKVFSIKGRGGKLLVWFVFIDRLCCHFVVF